MTLAKRLIPLPTAAAKKNDDARDTSPRSNGGAGTLAMWTLRGPRKKRILLGLLALVALYFFVKYIPTDVPPVSQRTFLGHGISANRASPASDEDAPPRQPGATKERYFDGPVKFYHLTSSLYSAIIPHDNARNVLFGISNLKTAANVLPMACEMAKRKRNRVHVALFGRNALAIDTVKQLHALSDLDCPVSWHDGRPDYAPYSSDQRMETSVKAALSHLLYHLRPHAVVVNDAAREDYYFVGAVEYISGEASIPVITLPDLAHEKVGWICQLDGASLRTWDQIQIEILVHGSPTSSASFIRLLKSIAEADYVGTGYPRLTIELPESIDPPTLGFLSSFRWPPGSSEADSKMSVRRRLSSKHLTPIEASLRTVESFYPVHPDRNHLLILTPDAELSSSYIGYLKYLLLEYKYSDLAISSDSASQLMGISLESPSVLLNDTKWSPQMLEASPAPLYLWQAPNSQAALYFGDKWVEFHSFLSHRLATSSSAASAGVISEAETHLAWPAYLLELTRARNYFMLYPHIKSGGSPVVTIHHDLYRVPDEFSGTGMSTLATESSTRPDKLSSKGVLTDERERARLSEPEPFSRNTEDLTSILLGPSGNKTLPVAQSLSHYGYDGVLVDLQISLDSASRFANSLSLDVGGCESLTNRAPFSEQTANDLFCNDN